MQLRFRHAVALIAVPVFLCAGKSPAATAGGTLQVSATVIANCQVAATPLHFGSYERQPIAQSASINFLCTQSAPYTVHMSAGVGAGATDATRRMSSGNDDTLAYGLYQDSGHSQVWGSSGASGLSGTAPVGVQTLTVYGHMPAGQAAMPGHYADTVTVTVNY